MRHIKIFESFKGAYKLVNDEEKRLDMYEAPTVREVEKLRQICGTLGFPTDEPASHSYLRCPIAHSFKSSEDMLRWWKREDPDLEVVKSICLSDRDYLICPCTAMSASKDLADRYPNDPWDKSGEEITIKFSKFVDDYWQVTMHYTNNTGNKKHVFKCDGLRGLEAAVSGPIADYMRVFDRYLEFLGNEVEGAKRSVAEVTDKVSQEISEVKNRHAAELKATKKKLDDARKTRDKMKRDLLSARMGVSRS